MLGFVAALGAELTTGQSFMTQFSGNFLTVTVHLALFAGASLIPALVLKRPLSELVKEATGREGGGFGGTGLPEELLKFTPEAELLNGRAAMVGVASLIVFETLSGHALL